MQITAYIDLELTEDADECAITYRVQRAIQTRLESMGGIVDVDVTCEVDE